MSQQSEKPGILSKRRMAELKQSGSPDIYSGGQIENFREGWAVDIMNFGRVPKAHYFKRSEINIAFADALCNPSVVSLVRWLYGEGNHQRCKNCERKRRA